MERWYPNYYTYVVIGAKVKPPNPGKTNGLGAHGAWFQRHIEVAPEEALIVKHFRSLPQNEHLGMCCRVLCAHNVISSRRKQSAITHNDRPNWDFAAGCSAPGLIIGCRYKGFVHRPRV